MLNTTDLHHPLDLRNRYKSNEIIVGNIILDFSTLLPTAEQIATFDHPSTGNTPVASPMSSDQDIYSPLMLDSPIERQASFHGPLTLSTLFDSLFLDSEPMRPLQSQDFDSWKDVLDGYSHEEYCEALSDAARNVNVCQRHLADLHLVPERGFCSAMNDMISWCAEAKGLLIGMPLRLIPWYKVSKDMIQDMSTMAVRSGILQACAAVYRLFKEMINVRDQIWTLLRPSEGLLEYLHRDENDDRDEHGLEGREITSMQRRTHDLASAICCPIEGKYKSAADREYILRLPMQERESIYTERRLAVLRLEQSMLLLCARLTAKRKREEQAVLEDKDSSISQADAPGDQGPPPRKRRESTFADHRSNRKRDRRTAFGLNDMSTEDADALAVAMASLPRPKRLCAATKMSCRDI